VGHGEGWERGRSGQKRVMDVPTQALAAKDREARHAQFSRMSACGFRKPGAAGGARRLGTTDGRDAGRVLPAHCRNSSGRRGDGLLRQEELLEKFHGPLGGVSVEGDGFVVDEYLSELCFSPRPLDGDEGVRAAKPIGAVRGTLIRRGVAKDAPPSHFARELSRLGGERW